METEAHKKLRYQAEKHGMAAVPGLMPKSVRFEKPGLSVETIDYHDFWVVRGDDKKHCSGFPELAIFLESEE